MPKTKVAPTPAAANVAAVEIDRIAAETIRVPILGTAPLIIHRFSGKQKKVMLDKMQGHKTPRMPKDPVAEFEAASHRFPEDDEGYGFPAVGFKLATIGAARFYPKNDVTMTGLKQFLFFGGEMGIDGQLLVRLENPDDAGIDSPKKTRGVVRVSDIPAWPKMQEDVVRVNRGGSDLRYRPVFWPWAASLEVTYVTSALTRGSVLSLIDAGGLGVGVGEWRPARSGDNGTYRIDVSKDVEVIG